MWMTPFSFCSTPVTLISRAPITTGRYCSNLRGHTIVLAMPVSSSSVMKMALPLPGRWRTSTRPADGHTPAGHQRQEEAHGERYRALEIDAQE